MVQYEYAVNPGTPAVNEGVKDDSAAAQAGLQAGDRIVRVDGIENPTWEQLQPRVWLSPNQPLTISIQRGDQVFEKTIVPKAVTSSEGGSAGWFPKQPVIVGRLEAEMPAAKAGIKENNRIVTIDTIPIASLKTIIHPLQ